MTGMNSSRDSRRRLIARLETAEIGSVALRKGYSMPQVNEWLDGLARALASGRDPRTRGSRPQFTITRFVNGYVIQDVEDLLDEVLSWPL